jgi:hypothetical protein
LQNYKPALCGIGQDYGHTAYSAEPLSFALLNKACQNNQPNFGAMLYGLKGSSSKKIFTGEFRTHSLPNKCKKGVYYCKDM